MQKTVSITKLVLVMRLTVVLLLSACLGVRATGFSQTITVTVREATLEKVFSIIKKQTGYVVFGNAITLRDAKPVTVSVEKMQLPDFLQLILKDQQLTYLIQKNTIFLVARKMPAEEAGMMEEEALPPLKGRVLGPDGQPLEGASVKVKRTNEGVSTDKEGGFSLDIKPGDVLIISYTGMVSKELKVTRERSVNITLALADSKLDEIQIVAYGQTSKRFNVGNITTVKSEDIAKSPVSNVLQAIQGRVPGVFITQASGYAGSGFNVAIQGQNSLQQGNEPYYVVDGIPYISSNIYSISKFVVGNSGINPLSMINPADIESVTFLKDADATAIYGSRAANGAVLITTKKGKPGPGVIDISIKQGRSFLPRRAEMLNTRQYMEMRREAKKNDGAPVYATDYDLNGTWDSTRYTDWQKVLFPGHAQFTEVNAGFSGGSAAAHYALNASFGRQATLLAPNFTDQRGSVRFYLGTASANQKFKADISLGYTYDINQLPGYDVTFMSLELAPNAPALYQPDGSLNWQVDGNGRSTWWNPMSRNGDRLRVITKGAFASLTLSYELLSGLQLSMRTGFNDLISDTRRLIPLSVNAPQDLPYSDRSVSLENADNLTYSIEPQLVYNSVIGGAGKLEATAGFSMQGLNIRGRTFSGYGFSSDKAMEEISFARDKFIDPGTFTNYRQNGGFGRINYIHAGKYIVNLTGRRDASSRFGPANRAHSFGAVGAGWILSQEPFFQPAKKVLSFAKVNLSYGITGNDQIGDYTYMDLFYPYVTLRNYQSSPSLRADRLVNPFLQWEETSKLNLGISMGLLRDRIMIETDLFRNRSSNQVVGITLPGSTGFYAISSNLPATVQNTGLGIVINSVNVKSRNFSWSSRLNVTFAKNQLWKFPNLANSSFASYYFIGKSLALRPSFNFKGVDAQTGLYTFVTRDGKVTSSPDWLVDRYVMLDMFSPFYGGLENTLTYKTISFSFFFQFVKQRGADYNSGNGSPGTMTNQPVSVLKRWQKPGDIAEIQRFTSENAEAQGAAAAFLNSNAASTNASYARLKNLSISWSLPGSWTRPMHLREVQLSGQAQNLLTITPYKIGDPEVLSYRSMPPLRTFTFVLRVGI